MAKSRTPVILGLAVLSGRPGHPLHPGHLARADRPPGRVARDAGRRNAAGQAETKTVDPLLPARGRRSVRPRRRGRSPPSRRPSPRGRERPDRAHQGLGQRLCPRPCPPRPSSARSSSPRTGSPTSISPRSSPTPIPPGSDGRDWPRSTPSSTPWPSTSSPIKKVFILVDGEERETLDGHITLDRAFAPDFSLVAKD